MQKYECKVCGAELHWDPNAGALKCKYCDSEFQPSDFEDKTVEAKTTDTKELDKDYTNAGSSLGDDMVVYKCEECGAEVVASKTTMATTCAYCGRAISVTGKTAEGFRPEKVIPFTIDKEKAMATFQKYIKSSPLTPKEFSQKHVIEKFQGLFVPFYLHSMDVRSDGIVDAENSSSRRSGDDKITTVREYEIDMDAEGSFKYIPTDASKELENGLMDALEPYSYGKITDFNPAYMAGYLAEQPDETVEDTYERAASRAKAAMNESMVKEAGTYGAKRMQISHHKISNQDSKYTMLPLWLMNVDYNGEKLIYAINGETGKAVGKLPLSKKRLATKLVGCFGIIQIAAAIFFAIM